MPLVTVGIPVYNAASLLREGLDCICQQTMQDIEIVVSDNASTDDTPKILAEYAGRDDRIRLLRQPQNVGMQPNFTAVLDAATAPYFLWRAYDDYSDREYIDTLYNLLEEKPDKGLAIPKIVRKDLEGTTSSEKYFPQNLETCSTVQRTNRLLSAAQASWFYGLYRTEELRPAWNKVIANYPHIWGHDHLVLLSFILNGRIDGTDRAVFTQRETGISQSSFKPKTASAQRAMASQFLRYSFRELSCSALGKVDRMALVLPLIRYTNGKVEKYRRIATRMLAEQFSRNQSADPA